MVASGWWDGSVIVNRCHLGGWGHDNVLIIDCGDGTTNLNIPKPMSDMF